MTAKTRYIIRGFHSTWQDGQFFSGGVVCEGRRLAADGETWETKPTGLTAGCVWGNDPADALTIEDKNVALRVARRYGGWVDSAEDGDGAALGLRDNNWAAN